VEGLPKGRYLMPGVVGDTHTIVWYLSGDPRLSVADALELVSRNEVPDLPDRIVTATAVALRVPLISRDRKIRASQVQTIW
jgi:PIN domain nuclease of toxin-antitoxin system